MQKLLLKDLEEKRIFDQARKYAFDYLDQIDDMDVFPAQEKLDALIRFEESVPEKTASAQEILHFLNKWGSPATIAQTGGRYFGFVNGGAIPIALAVKWLTDVWDQCAGLFLASPINAKLESVCEQWLKSIFDLPQSTVAGFVSGTSMANLSGMAAARYQLLKNQGWDVNESGLNGAPPIRVIAHNHTHASVKRILGLLGFGLKTVEWLPSDKQGRILTSRLPKLDASCLLLLQAGNVNSGAFDDFEFVCNQANKVGAWVHIDGAFGLWAAATTSLKHLTMGINKASSWAVDAHKTLNTPYDSGIVLCKYPEALRLALSAQGSYLTHTQEREPLDYTPELSKRARAIELWATIKYLGKEGIDEMVCGFHIRAKQLAEALLKLEYEILNEVVFNQVLVRFKDDKTTNKIMAYIQHSGECWVGGSVWHNQSVIRVSICSWRTTEEDIQRTVNTFKKAKQECI